MFVVEDSCIFFYEKKKGVHNYFLTFATFKGEFCSDTPRNKSGS